MSLSLRPIIRELPSSSYANFQRIPLIVHRSAGDKLTVDLLVLLVCRLSPPKREKECLANFFQSKICELVSGKLSKFLLYRVIRTL